jgi:predicted aspartyl protease
MRKVYLGLVLTCLLITLKSTVGHAQNKLAFSIPFTLIDNRPFIEAKINGHTFHFILDCGADYGLDTKTAEVLNLKPGNKSMMGGGAGANKVPVWTAIIDTTQIGPVDVLKTSFLVIDMSEIKNKLHLPFFDGVIGYSFMKDYAVQFDYPNHVINFYNAYSAPSPIPFTMFDGQIPKINGQIDGKDAIVIVDTGDRTALTILNHYAIKTGILNSYHLSDTTITGYGLGGPIYARTLILKHLHIGNIDIADVPSRIPMLKSGAFADPGIDASIGGGVLKRYKFTIDYKKQALYFE